MTTEHNEQSVATEVAGEMREYYDAEVVVDDDVLKRWIDRLAAPVTAAPDDGFKEVAERAVLAFARVAEALGIDPAGGADAALAAMAKLRTPAAPGIDPIEAIQTFARAYKAEVPHAELTVHGIDAGLRAVALIAASPKGAEAQQAAAQAMVIALTDGYRWNGQRWQRYSPDGALIEHFGAAEGLGSTTAATRSIRVPAGWALVPDRMQLTPENMELLADTLRGVDEDEPWCGGVLWIGQTTDDDGEPTYYGLNVANVECMEEGSINIVEFTPPQDSPKGGSEAAHADGWRVIPHTSPWREGERWEVYGPNGGGSVNAGDIKDQAVRELLDALAGLQASDAEVRP